MVESSTYPVQFEVESASVADGAAIWVSPPQRGVVRPAIAANHPLTPRVGLERNGESTVKLLSPVLWTTMSKLALNLFGHALIYCAT